MMISDGIILDVVPWYSWKNNNNNMLCRSLNIMVHIKAPQIPVIALCYNSSTTKP